MFDCTMLGTRPNGIQPSPRPKADLNFNPFDGGYKFAYIAVEEMPITNFSDSSVIYRAKALVERLLGQGTTRSNVLIGVGRVNNSNEQLAVGAFSATTHLPEKIIDTCHTLSKQYLFNEVWTDYTTYDWLKANNLWSIYCGSKGYELSLCKIKRHVDPLVRRLEMDSAREKGLIGLMPHLQQNKAIVDALKQVGLSIECEVVSGLLQVALRYR